MAETIWQAYKNGTFTLSKQGEIKYNAADHPDHHRGDMGEGKPKAARIYSVHSIDSSTGLAKCESRDAWGGIHYEAVFAETLIVLEVK